MMIRRNKSNLVYKGLIPISNFYIMNHFHPSTRFCVTNSLNLITKRSFTTNGAHLADSQYPSDDSSEGSFSSDKAVRGARIRIRDIRRDMPFTREDTIKNVLVQKGEAESKMLKLGESTPKLRESVETSSNDISKKMLQIENMVKSDSSLKEESAAIDFIKERQKWEDNRLLAHTAEETAKVAEKIGLHKESKELSEAAKKFMRDSECLSHDEKALIFSHIDSHRYDEFIKHKLPEDAEKIQAQHNANMEAHREVKKSSLIDDFADVSTEMPSYMDPED